MPITTLRRFAPASLTVALFTAMPASGQVLNEDAKITASDAAASDSFGRAVAVSGNTAIVGAHFDSDAGSNTGAAYLFDTTTGLQISKLTASDAAQGDNFGWSVAISGTRAIVGATADDDAGSGSGSAYIFDTTTGLQIAKLTASDGAAGDNFGWSVAISGTTAIVGAYLDDDAGSGSGSAYIFDTTTGLQIAKLTASDAAPSDRFGWSVAISGTTAIVGAPFDDDAGSISGSAYLFDITTGQQIAKLTASDAAGGDEFGDIVAISGTTAIVGVSNDDDAGSGSGSVYLFDTTTGQQIAKLTASDAAESDEFGKSVAIFGTTAIVGASGNDDAGSNSGSAYLFDTTTGLQIAKLTASDAAAVDLFGWSVAISDTAAIVGALGNDDAGSGSGSAYLFNAAPAIIAQPQSDIVDFGATATFQVELASTDLVSYQWRRNSINLTDTDNISGSTTATLQVVATDNDPAFYDCVITRWGTPGQTQQVVLAVRPDPNSCFADVNNDGILNFFDISGFINAYNAGCP